MKEVVQLLRDMQAAGIIRECALIGAMAQMRYTAPVATLDVDVLVNLPSPDRLDPLRGIYTYCRERGYAAQGDAIRVGEWPVQFLPVFNSLTGEALERAENVDLEGIPIRVVGPDYLAVIALSTGRWKDKMRILSLLESQSTTLQDIENLAGRHGLAEAWREFKGQFHDA